MTSPYGSWTSPFSAAAVAASAPRIDGARFVGEEIWWGESVPREGGRVSVRSSSGAEVLPGPWSARSRVHEYGGGAWTASDDATLFFVDADDQRIYRMPRGGRPLPLTPRGANHGGLRWEHGRLWAVREDLTRVPHLRAIIEVPVDGSAAENAEAVTVVAEGPGFFAHPAPSPDGTRVAWVEWAEDAMPWDSATLRLGFTDGRAGAPVTLGTRAALQPEWLDDDTLAYLDDPTGRWNLYRAEVSPVASAVASTAPGTSWAPADADTGGGLWVLGNRWYQPITGGRVVAVRTNGSDEVVVVAPDGGVTTLVLPVDAQASIDDARGSRVLLSGGGSTVSAGLWCVDVDTGAVVTVRGGEAVDTAWMPAARRVTFDGPHGTVHAFDYAPANPRVTPDAAERPPYVVFVHGGPTANVAGACSPAIAYYTSRGIGVLDVNYGGSTGYGRAYRERLHGGWGIVDVDDVDAAARGLAESGAADPARIAIRGGSAGGWTVLCALVRGGAFAAGISRYGVADLRMLAADTHDFERHYLTGLVGPLPEAEERYIERSPLTNAERIGVPVLLMQGSEDRVVPPSQSEAIRQALADRGVPHEYLLFPGEGHGFRRSETIAAALEAELAFLGRVFGFTPRV